MLKRFQVKLLVEKSVYKDIHIKFYVQKGGVPKGAPSSCLYELVDWLLVD
jgi:hypothetical protein